MECFTTEQVRRVRRVPFYQPVIDDTLRADSCTLQTRQKDTLSAEDLGVLLQWHWKYGTAVFTNERQRVQLSLLMLLRERPTVRPLPAKLYPPTGQSLRETLIVRLLPERLDRIVPGGT